MASALVAGWTIQLAHGSELKGKDPRTGKVPASVKTRAKPAEKTEGGQGRGGVDGHDTAPITPFPAHPDAGRRRRKPDQPGRLLRLRTNRRWTWFGHRSQ